MQAEEGVLHHVFRGRLVAEQQYGEPDKAESVRPVELADRSGRGLNGVHGI